MKKSKNIILALIIVVIVIIIIIIAILLNLLKKNSHLIPDETEYGLEADLKKTVSIVQDRNKYYIVKNIIESYYSDLAGFNMTEDDVLVYNPDEEDWNTIVQGIESERRAFKNKVYNCLDEEYIKKQGITLDNIGIKLGNYKDVVTLIDDMYVFDIEETLQAYFVSGTVIEKTTSKKDKFSIMVTVDGGNSTFEIYPNGYNYDVKVGAELKINKTEVKNKTFNKYTYKIINEEDYCVDMLKDYKDRIVYNIDSAYNVLNEEYKKAKFSNLTEFQKYIQNNYSKLININLNSYQRRLEDDGMRYVLIDKSKDGYIFKETAPMKYTLILDTYTIDIPEIVEKYEASNEQEKVIININKFMQSLNDKDYKYAYKLLADSFKENNFKTEAEFESYAKANFFDSNEVIYEKFGSEAGTYYTYSLKIKDKSQKSKKQIDKKFIILLEENRGFKLSFNI